MTRWIVALALALSGCYRGCSLNSSPLDTCSESSDCEHGRSCRDGYCMSQHYIEIDDQCRAGSACTESGDCTAIRKESFLGIDPGMECAAVNDRDCAVSRGCTERGACERTGSRDVGCGAANTVQCVASERCRSHEECVLEGATCVRDLTTCPQLPSNAPSWAGSARLVWDYDSLRTPWQPGSLDNATLACRYEGKQKGDSTLRVAGRCTEGPVWDHHERTSLRADVPLHIGDSIAIAVQQRPLGYPSDGFAQLRYTGSSPMTGGSAGEEIECVVVPRTIAVDRAKRELAAVDSELAATPREQVDISRPKAVGAGIDAARVHAERAAKWLGWRDPELVARIAKIDAAQAAWIARVDAAIRAQPVVTTARTRTFQITILGRVCGPALHTRAGSAAAPTDVCALEIAIDNIDGRPATLWSGSDLFWLHAADDGAPASIEKAKIVELLIGTTRTPYELRELQPDQRATILVTGLEAGALLAGSLDYSDAFVLRP